MNYLSKAIKLLKPDAEFSFTDNDYSTIKWIVLDGDAPTEAEIDAAIKAVKSEEKADIKAKAAQRQAILDKLGLTASEAQLLLG